MSTNIIHFLPFNFFMMIIASIDTPDEKEETCQQSSQKKEPKQTNAARGTDASFFGLLITLSMLSS